MSTAILVILVVIALVHSFGIFIQGDRIDSLERKLKLHGDGVCIKPYDGGYMAVTWPTDPVYSETKVTAKPKKTSKGRKKS